MTEQKKLGDYCWVCMKEGKESPSTGRKYGYPVCDAHNNNNLDPEEMEKFVIDIFKGLEEVQP